MINSLYEKLIESKTGDLIPLTISGKTLESRYNPLNDIERTYASIKIDCDFCVILGIQSGLLINEILRNNPNIFILAIENTYSDINLLMNSDLIKSLSKLPNIVFSSIEDLSKNLINYFKPVFFNKIQVIEQRNWIRENKNICQNIFDTINTTLNIISRDFSVQSHFGKLWMHNFFSNLKYLQYTNSNFHLPLDKTAIILGAGPSVDYKLKDIIINRKKYFIIATDTSFESLNKMKVSADAVLSIDAQYISSNHFLNAINENTIFIFDICGNSSAVNKIFHYSKNIFFFNSGHPLSNLFDYENQNILLNLYSGSGTVTITALDFAVKSGFSDIQILGADFGYINNKTYMSGTYLDNLYNSSSTKISSNEFSFSKLMYRIPLIKKSNVKSTTEVLENYETSLIEYLKNHNLNFLYKEDIYFINQTKSLNTNCYNFENKIFKYEEWFSKYINYFSINNEISIYNLQAEEYSLLPLMSFLKKHDNNSIIGVNHLYKKAIDFLERYK